MSEPSSPRLRAARWVRARARGSRATAVVVLAVVALGSGACAKTINVSALESEVADQVAAQQGVPRSEVTVDCPDEISVGEATVTPCSASVAGEDVVVEVTQIDGDGRIEWVVVPPEAEPAP